MPITKPSCSTCPNWYKPAADATTGDCRLAPPFAITQGSKTTYGWPQTAPTDWCGQHPQFHLFMRENLLGQVPTPPPPAPPPPPQKSPVEDMPPQRQTPARHPITHRNKT
jgi:hypothetical protein